LVCRTNENLATLVRPIRSKTYLSKITNFLVSYIKL
jgi:hypothetical protein